MPIVKSEKAFDAGIGDDKADANAGQTR